MKRQRVEKVKLVEVDKIEDRKNIKQKKSKRSCEILSILKDIYSRKWYIGERVRFRECKKKW